MRPFCFLSVALLLLLAGGCTRPVEQERPVAPGIVRRQIFSPKHGRIWIYLPEKTDKNAQLPCILIAPAGSPLCTGMSLGKGDMPEHLPWVKAGYAVVAYELSGATTDKPNDEQVYRAAKEFLAADCGLNDTRNALDYIEKNIPQIDKNRIFAAGHSSAATVALQIAENDPRIKACIAFAPASDVPGQIGKPNLDALDAAVPGSVAKLRANSPLPNAAKLRCPLFVFHAQDDSVVDFVESIQFTDAVKKTNPRVTFAQVSTGDHYDAMIQQGIPRAIAWLKTLPENKPK